jgi:hypothetical protein
MCRKLRPRWPHKDRSYIEPVSSFVVTSVTTRPATEREACILFTDDIGGTAVNCTESNTSRT